MHRFGIRRSIGRQ